MLDLYYDKVRKEFYKQYTNQYEEAAGEFIDGKCVIWFYHTIWGDNIGVYLDDTNSLQVYSKR